MWFLQLELPDRGMTYHVSTNLFKEATETELPVIVWLCWVLKSQNSIHITTQVEVVFGLEDQTKSRTLAQLKDQQLRPTEAN